MTLRPGLETSRLTITMLEPAAPLRSRRGALELGNSVGSGGDLRGLYRNIDARRSIGLIYRLNFWNSRVQRLVGQARDK